MKGWCRSLFQRSWASQALALETPALSKVAPVPQFLQRCYCSCVVFCSTVMDLSHALKLNCTVYLAPVFQLLSGLRSGQLCEYSHRSNKYVLRYPCPLPKDLLAAAPRRIAPNVCVYFNERMSSESYFKFFRSQGDHCKFGA